MAATKDVLSIVQVTDCSTGIYSIGEYDFRIPVSTHEDLDEHPEKRVRLARMLHWMAVEIDAGRLATFRPSPSGGGPDQAKQA